MGARRIACPTVRWIIIVILVLYVNNSIADPLISRPTELRFEVILGPPRSTPGGRVPAGRLMVVLGPASSSDPRLKIGQTGMDASPVLGRDIGESPIGARAAIDARSAIFPLDDLSQLRPGTYAVQAVLHTNRDLDVVNAPEDFYSPVKIAHLDPAKGGTIELELSRQVPAEQMPADTDLVKHVKIRSPLLSAFHGRPIDIRAGVILPRDFASQPGRRYPLRVHIGGYGARYTNVDRMMAAGNAFRQSWMSEDSPRMILLHLDGTGPLGDPYQVDSANHGPYGAAVTRELIPFVEDRFRAIGRGDARVLDGGSTGGWVALALQIFYPEMFNGAWAFCPDGVDFRGFQLIDIYADANAYLNRHGFERPAARDISGDVRYTMRHECRLENVLGQGDSWALSGGQWGAWNATYGPRGSDGRPVPLWDPKTGAIDRAVVDHWKAYDLRRRLQQNWANLASKLRGKMHIWVGEADDYFLENAVHHLDDFLTEARPAYGGSVTFGAGKGHCWIAIPEREMMKQMAQRMSTAVSAVSGER
jgi:hypothetical protein